MLRFRTILRSEAFRRGLLVVLLLAFGAASFTLGAEAFHGSYRHQNGVILLQGGGEWDDAETAETAPSMEQETEAASRQQLPAWLQIVLTVGIALLIYYIILMLIQRRRRRDEEIIHYKDIEPDSGFEPAQTPEPARDPEQATTEYRVPTQPRTPQQEKAPGTGRQRSASKNVSWGVIIAIIAVLNIIRRCMQNN